MTIDYNQTADALDRMAVQQQAMADAAAAFRTLGSIEGATKEANAKRADAEAARDEALQEYNAALDKAAEVRVHADEVRVNARNDIARAIEEANDKTTKLVQDAVDRAKVIESDAKAAAEATIKKTNEDLSSAHDQLDALDVDIRTRTATRDGLIAEAEAAEKRLTAVRDAIAALKAA